MEKMGSGTPTVGRQVVYHAASGDYPALVTRANVDGTLSLTIFAVGDIVYRDNVKQVDGGVVEDDEKVGYWEWPNRV